MARRTDEQLAQLRTAQQQTTEQLTKTLAAGLDDSRRAADDVRRELGDTVSAGFAELRHDNTQLRDQLTEALREGFGSLRAENLELRARLDRAAVDLAEARRQIETMRAEAAEARIAATVAAVPVDAEPAEALESDDGQEGYEELLQQAAGIAYATLACHRDTWDFLVAQSAQFEHFRLPAAVTEQGGGLVGVGVSGRTLIAVLDALWHTRHAANSPAGTRALAGQVYERIAAAVATVHTSSQPAEEPGPDGEEPATRHVVRITIDDRP